MSDKCFENVLSKFILFSYGITSFIMLSFSLDMYREYQKENNVETKNKWLKYQLPLFFASFFVLVAFFYIDPKIKGSDEIFRLTLNPTKIQQPPKYIMLVLFLLLFVNLIIGGSKTYTAYYVIVSIQMILSLYLAGIIIKELLDYNKEDYQKLKQGVNKVTNKVTKTVKEINKPSSQTIAQSNTQPKIKKKKQQQIQKQQQQNKKQANSQKKQQIQKKKKQIPKQTQIKAQPRAEPASMNKKSIFSKQNFDSFTAGVSKLGSKLGQSSRKLGQTVRKKTEQAGQSLNRKMRYDSLRNKSSKDLKTIIQNNNIKLNSGTEQQKIKSQAQLKFIKDNKLMERVKYKEFDRELRSIHKLKTKQALEKKQIQVKTRLQELNRKQQPNDQQTKVATNLERQRLQSLDSQIKKYMNFEIIPRVKQVKQQPGPQTSDSQTKIQFTNPLLQKQVKQQPRPQPGTPVTQVKQQPVPQPGTQVKKQTGTPVTQVEQQKANLLYVEPAQYKNVKRPSRPLNMLDQIKLKTPIIQ